MGIAKRKEMGAKLYKLDCSPIIAYDDEKAPEYAVSSFAPSTVAGRRMPHFWLARVSFALLRHFVDLWPRR